MLRAGLLLPICFFAWLSWSSATANAGGAANSPIAFESHILPLLQIRCAKCHGEGKMEGGLDIRRKFQLLKGGDSGPAIIEGKPEESLLLQKLEKGEMPPEDEGQLN